MGQTGVGKSSLINAIFNTALKTDAVRPCTMEIELIKISGESGREMWFYDLPGIDENKNTNSTYLSQYIKIMQSDVVVWAIHADNRRSVLFDIDAFNLILTTFNNEERSRLMSKITFALTKVDLLTPRLGCLLVDLSTNELRHDEDTVFYQGVMAVDVLQDYIHRWPHYKAVFKRLYDDSQGIPCSSLFRYNLAQFMLILVNKLGFEAIRRFRNF